MSSFTERFFEGGGWRYFVLPGLLFLVVLVALITGNGGFVEVNPGQVAVKYDNISNGREVVQQQGTMMYWPFFQSVELLSLEPQVLVMEGGEDFLTDEDGNLVPNRAPKLTVRANDGSKFWFDKLEIHYQIMPELADVVIESHGRDEGFKHGPVATHAREVLRNEFGRYSFLEIADPSSYSTATNKAKNALNDRLKPYGILVTQIITPKPSFTKEVETAIEDRQTADQAVEVQITKRERLEAQKDLLVQEVKTKGNNTYQALVADLEAQQKQAENKAMALRREAFLASEGRLCLSGVSPRAPGTAVQHRYPEA